MYSSYFISMANTPRSFSTRYTFVVFFCFTRTVITFVAETILCTVLPAVFFQEILWGGQMSHLLKIFGTVPIKQGTNDEEIEKLMLIHGTMSH